MDALGKAVIFWNEEKYFAKQSKLKGTIERAGDYA